MKNLWAVISRTWRALTAIAGIIGVLFLWQDLQDLPKAMGLPDAYSWAWRWLLELERETVAFLLLGLALAWILWIDARPLVWRWLENRKPQQIIISDTPYCESYILKPSPDEKAQFYTNVFYLPVGNGLDTGQTLKRVQVRIFHVGPPTLCRIKDTEAEEVDIRHGEWAYFEIGQVVSKEMMGLIFGTRIGNGGRLEAYRHNIPRGVMTFEVTPLIKNQEYHLNTTPDLPTIWPLLIVVSADEVKALQVSVTIDFSEAKSPMTFEMRI